MHLSEAIRSEVQRSAEQHSGRCGVLFASMLSEFLFSRQFSLFVASRKQCSLKENLSRNITNYILPIMEAQVVRLLICIRMVLGSNVG